ncbi:hypothetical protein [Actinacidiphila glaucinigra]|uniref:TetR family transcriptional regulator n=1 Tax=Actinacidiphila glaucinigra TaxID=235986 RepID=A0A239LHE6_9ACTN|nr:hypothetical protein [Actinacidiphila glaucinigra]SNT29785.1 hypothetical protein SAMN05216252_1202 [Actinacidiphila glaucinigra]
MPRAGLDRATVGAAASELADELGFAGPTMGTPAKRVGVRTPSVRALCTVIHGFVGLDSNDAFQTERDPADSHRFVVDTLINDMRPEAANGGPDTAPLHAGEGA